MNRDAPELVNYLELVRWSPSSIPIKERWDVF